MYQRPILEDFLEEAALSASLWKFRDGLEESRAQAKPVVISKSKSRT